jgi:hypothetical protein
MNERQSQNVKEMLRFLFSLGELSEAAITGGISFSLVGKVIETVKDAFPAFADAAMIPVEFANLSAEEKADLKAFIDAEFDIPEEGIEDAIKLALKVMVDLSDLLKLILKK